MKVCLRATTTAFDDTELTVPADEIQALKQVDAIEVNEERFIPYELVFDADNRKFILWVDKE